MSNIANNSEELNRAFHISVCGGLGTDFARLAELVGDGADVNSYAPYGAANGNYQTALGQAVDVNNYGLAMFLIDMGADVNRLTHRSGQFPLHCAIGRRNRTMIRTLLCHGADMDARHDDGESPRELAARLNVLEIF